MRVYPVRRFHRILIFTAQRYTPGWRTFLYITGKNVTISTDFYAIYMQRRHGLILAFTLGRVILSMGQPLPYTAQQRATIETTRQTLQTFQGENYQRAVAVAKQRGKPITLIQSGGRVVQLDGITETGELLYITTYSNARAAATTRTTSLYAGGSLGLNLSGSSPVVQNRLGIWDGSRVRNTHVELAGRVTQMDNAAATSTTDDNQLHATHVSGTMIASGINPNARGMAFGAKLQAWDFSNDVSEMTANAVNLLISNHSYGTIAGWNFNDTRTGTVQWEWYGDTTISQTEDYKFGFYNDRTTSWDRIAASAPSYLIVKSAGNDHGPTGPAAGAPYYLYNNGNKQSTVARSTQAGYDQIPDYGTAKNILLVGAVSAIANGYNQPADVKIASFSSWGPTDDGRIKPDIVGVGVSLLSSGNASDSAYATLSGTSMSSPNVAGSLLLLQEYYAQLNPGKLMRASTLKGLALHTADEAGANPGPDYQYGWGLLNMERAAQVMGNASKSNLLDERTINQGETYTLPVVASGKGPLTVTICWTDPEATATAVSKANLNNRTPKLINDLDIRVADGSATRLPWTLNPDQPDQAATPGDNIRDNVEQVLIANAVPGKSYTITINHKGTLKNSKQDYALLVSGIGGTAYCASAAATPTDSKISRVQFGSIDKTAADGCITTTDNTTLVAAVQAGQTLPLIVTTGTCGAAHNTIVKAFIDWNQNGSFDDAGETVATSGVLASGAVFNASVTVPTSVTNGQFTRLRIVEVATEDPAAVTSCGVYAVGETQDFTLQYVRPANDVGITALIAPDASFCSQASQLIVSVQVRNFGTATQAAVPVSVRILDQNNTEIATLTGSSLAIPGFVSANVPIRIPAGLVLQPGQSYRFIATTNLPGDQVSTNNQISETRITALLPTVGTLSAQTCGTGGAVTLSNPGSNGTAYWYSAATGGDLLAVGNQTATAIRPPNNVYYVALNDFSGRLGPTAKTDFGGGSYSGNFGPSPLISTKVPLVLKSARIYTGSAGRLTFTVRKYDETAIAAVSIDVSASRTLPLSATTANGQLADDPNDMGVEYPLNLKIPVPGDYKITIAYEDGVSIFRSNTAVTGFPFSLPGVISTKGSLFNTSATQVDTLTAAWYYLYNLQVGALGCPAPQRTAVTAGVGTVPTAFVTPNGSTSICQGSAVTLTGSTNATTATYQWLLDGKTISGATSTTYLATTGGNYTLQVNTSCPATSTVVAVSVRTAVLPVVTQNGFTLTSNAATGNQWLKNGVAIGGATSATLVVTETGRYSVRSNGNGCGELISDEVVVTILATEPTVADDLFRVYPNPASTVISVEASAGAGPVPTLQLIDARGIVVRTAAMQLSGKLITATVDVSGLSSGTFLVRLSGDSAQPARVKRMIKR